MKISAKILLRTALFAAIMVIFAAIEWRLWRDYTYPDHMIERRHEANPLISAENRIFGEYDGEVRIKFPAQVSASDFARVRGVRFKTGTYGKIGWMDRVDIVSDSGQVICSNNTHQEIAENKWNNILLKCDAQVYAPGGGISLMVSVPREFRWALYSASGDVPAIQLWLEDQKFLGTFWQARNYGDLWNTPLLTSFRILTRTILALGLVFLLIPSRATESRRVSALILIWAGLFWAQFFETITYHNADESMHIVGAFKAVTDGESWPKRLDALNELGADVQFWETYQKPTQPIVVGWHGHAILRSDGVFVDPNVRSGQYAFMLKRMARNSVALSPLLAAYCRDLGAILRAQLGIVLSVILIGAFLFYWRLNRLASIYTLMALASIPAMISSFLTVWNYGLLTVLGLIFCVNLLPDGEAAARRKCLFFSAALIPILGELARSQVMWFVVGPFVVCAAWVFFTSGESRKGERIKGLAVLFLYSTLIFLVLIGLLGDRYIPDRDVLIELYNHVGGFFPIVRDMMLKFPLTSLLMLQCLAWLGSSAALIVLDVFLNALNGALNHRVKRALRNFGVSVLIVGLAILIRKCWSIQDPEYLPSLLALDPYPSFLAHIKSGYRALMSQTFSEVQDYFLVQTFFMAYGWLEVTGHWFIYFLFRHLMELGFLGIMLSCLFRFRAFIQYYLPLLLGFAVYFLVIWSGAWTGHFTIVGRFVFPAIGLLYIPVIVASSGFTSVPIDRQTQRRLKWAAKSVFFYFLINAIYGAFYLLPHRFILGL